MAWADLDLGFLFMKLGRFLESKTHLEQSLELARRISAKPVEVYALTYSGYRKLYAGEYSSAMETFQQTLPLHQALHQEHGVVAAEIGWGLALHHLGETSKGRARFQNAVDRSRRVCHRRRLAEALVGLGLMELDDFHLESAQEVLNEAVQLAQQSQCAENLAAGLAALARAERETGNFRSAMERCDAARSVVQQFALPACEIWTEIETALTYLALEQQDSALQHTSRAIQQIPQAYEGWIPFEEVYGTHAKVLQALGRDAEAHPFLQQARSLIEKKSENIYNLSQREGYLSRKLTRFSQ
jgi:tetratricopeptide (TPR) repeat protein